MKSDIELLGVEDYLRDNADRIIRSLKLILIGLFNYWYKYRIEDIPENERYKFYWYPLTLEFNEVRAKLLEKVISEFENEFKEK
jgi:hypothetical protein